MIDTVCDPSYNTKVATSRLAIAALITAICVPCLPVGLVLAIIALFKISRSAGTLKGNGLAIGAIAVTGVWLVVGTLAAFSIPNFRNFNLASRATEATINLSAIRTAQELFRVDHGGYAKAAPVGSGTSTTPWRPDPCDPKCSKENLDACNSFACLGFEPFEEPIYRYACNAYNKGKHPEFTCAAVADLDGDGTQKMFVYGTANRGGEMVVLPIPKIGVLGACKDGEVPAGRVHNCDPSEY